MTKYFIVFTFFYAMCANRLSAQQLPSIQLDRPDQTECPFITPKKYVQVENGFNIENSESSVRNLVFPTSLWKYGINEKLELRLITELTKENNTTGIKPITVGFKTSLLEEKGLIPKTSFIGHITTATLGSEDFHTSFLAPAFRFTMQHTLSQKVSLAYNLGTEWNGESAQQTYIYTLTTGISLTKKLGCYAEVYGFLQEHKDGDHRTDGGFTYLVNNNFILDFSAGINLPNTDPQNYLSLGASYRFKAVK
jgi:hypothetical protein